MKSVCCLLLCAVLLFARKNGVLHSQFHSYWYDQGAEISVFELEQARYGEVHKGEAVFIYVTEKMHRPTQIKAESAKTMPDAVPILKLNSMRKFPTGVYDYSTMQSLFTIIDSGSAQLKKITTTVQEWCGHVFSQINIRDDNIEYMGRSYFESEGDVEKVIPKVLLEEELWMTLRLHPDKVPLGDIAMVPSQLFLRFRHLPMKAYKAEATQLAIGRLVTYRIHYPELARTLEIVYSRNFPHDIQSWSEVGPSGFGSGATTLKTVARLKKKSFMPYWEKNRSRDFRLREKIGLKQ